MNDKNLQTEELIFDDTPKQNKRGDTILGTFEGPCADIVDGTRNGRHYSEKLWDRVFNDPIVKELFECGGILGELDHPAERSETKTSEVAICMAEPPTKGKDGLLYGKWDVLDTPNGRIAATLARYGYKFGISSRGSGDVYEDYNGNEEVDPDTYDFQAFDLVILPAVKKARLTFTEGLDKNTLSKALTESLNKSTPDERMIMENTLKRLNINLYENANSHSKDTVVDNIDEAKKNMSVENNEDTIITELQEALNSNQQLETKLVELQEKLSACYTRESEHEDEIEKYKKAISVLSTKASKVDGLEKRVTSLTEALSATKKNAEAKEKEVVSLNEQLKSSVTTKNSLKESVDKSNNRYQQLNERYSKEVSTKDAQIKSLTEALDKAKSEVKAKQSEYSNKLNTSNKLVEKYKRIANKAVDRYIESQALKLGVTSNEIKNRLPKSYTFNDIDSICESLQEYKVNMNKLPFRKLTENVQMKVTAPKSELPIPANNFDDEIDDALINLAGLQ